MELRRYNLGSAPNPKYFGYQTRKSAGENQEPNPKPTDIRTKPAPLPSLSGGPSAAARPSAPLLRRGAAHPARGTSAICAGRSIVV